MRNCTVGSVSVFNGCAFRRLIWIAMLALAFGLHSGVLRAETRWTPFIDLSAGHDDNILFTETDPVDDYIYLIKPGMAFEYNKELTQISAAGSVLVRRYQENNDLDNENFSFDLNGNGKLTERSGLQGRYNFTKDTTLDSELEETGRITIREDRTSNDAALNPNFDLTERTKIGLSARYRNVNYDSDTKVDYTLWDFGIPIRWRMASQVDTLFLQPGYTHRDSDTNRSNSYNLRFGWDHAATERLNLKLSLGARYTEHERLDSGETEENWGGLAELGFIYAFERSSLSVDFLRDLKNTANGDQAEVNRLSLRMRWDLTERMGAELTGRYYYTTTEGEVDDDTTEFITVGPYLFYNLTEDFLLYVAYEYSQETQKDIQGDPHADRNKIWAGITFNFPL